MYQSSQFLPPSATEAIQYSIVISFSEREHGVVAYHAALREVLQAVSGSPFEFIFVDNNSAGRTGAVLAEIAAVDRQVSIVRLPANHGCVPAFQAGFSAVRGKYVIFMCGDFRHEPLDLAIFLEQLQGGFDLVRGVGDSGCVGGFEGYRTQWLRETPFVSSVWGNISSMAFACGARVSEVPVRSQRSAHRCGSPHRLSRIADLLLGKILMAYLTRPLRYFVAPGSMILSLGIALAGRLFALHLSGIEILKAHAFLTFGSALLFLTGLQILSFGLLGQMILFRSRMSRSYEGARPLLTRK